MPEILVGRVDEFDDDTRVIIELEGAREIGVLRVGNEFYAYSNRCLHQGGPVCEGIVIGKVNVVLDDEKRALGRVFASELNIVCPWHGWEFDLKTGQSASEPSFRLHKFPVRVEEGSVYLIV